MATGEDTTQFHGAMNKRNCVTHVTNVLEDSRVDLRANRKAEGGGVTGLGLEFSGTSVDGGGQSAIAMDVVGVGGGGESSSARQRHRRQWQPDEGGSSDDLHILYGSPL